MASNTSSFPPTQIQTLTLTLTLLIFFAFFGTAFSQPTSANSSKCPTGALNLGACADVLRGLVGATIGQPHPPNRSCCPLIAGLVDLEAGACLCTAIKAGVLGIDLNVPLDIGLLLSLCNQTAPAGGFRCP